MVVGFSVRTNCSTSRTVKAVPAAEPSAASDHLHACDVLHYGRQRGQARQGDDQNSEKSQYDRAPTEYADCFTQQQGRHDDNEKRLRAPLHQKVIAGTASEAMHSLDGILGHESSVDIAAFHVDGGGASDIVFAVMHLLGLSFEPRIPRLLDHKLYAFEPKGRYGPLAPLFGNRLSPQLIRSHWDEIQRVIHALRHKVVTPSLILRKLSAYRQQNRLATALREIGRIERTLFTLRWFEDPDLRRLVTSELNKGEARNSLSRAVASHRRGHGERSSKCGRRPPLPARLGPHQYHRRLHLVRNPTARHRWISAPA